MVLLLNTHPHSEQREKRRKTENISSIHLIPVHNLTLKKTFPLSRLLTVPTPHMTWKII